MSAVVWVRAADSRLSRNYPDAECCRAGGEACIECRYLRGRQIPGRVEHAAVRQCEPCADPQLGQFPGGVGLESDVVDLQLRQRVSGMLTAAGPDGSNKYLSESDSAGGEFTIAVSQENLRRPTVVAVTTFQVRDEDTGVQDDHSGQSWRMSSRYPGP